VTKLTFTTDHINPYPYQTTNIPIFLKVKHQKFILIQINPNP